MKTEKPKAKGVKFWEAKGLNAEEPKKGLRAEQWQAAIGRAINRLAEEAHKHDLNAEAALRQKAALGKKDEEAAFTLLQIARQEADLSAAYLNAFAIIGNELEKEK